MSNPYIYRGPINNPDSFFGRVHELNEIAAFLRGNQSISIVGPRKIGKTSLLFHLMRAETRAQLELGDNHLFVYLDCEVLGEGSHEEIFGQFAGEMEAALEDCDLPSEPALEKAIEKPGRISFERAVRRLNQRGLQIVLILDEFERLSTNPHLNVNFFNALRSVAGRYQLAFMTASARPLIQLTFSEKSREILSSPFFNIFALIFLRLFPEDEAHQAICTPAEKQGEPFTQNTIDFVYKLVGGHPLGIQVTCFHAFEKPRDILKIEQRAAQELQPHHQYYWYNLTDAEQVTLTQINDAVTRAATDTTLRGILRDLVQKCLLVYDGKTYRYPYKAWEKFVANQRPTAPSIFAQTRTSLIGLKVGPYEIMTPIGRGGMAEIYRGHHNRLERTVAIKILPESLAAESDFRDRFEREAQAVAALRHPNIVQVFDFGDINGMYYMVMEFIPGQNLSRLIQKKGPLSLGEVVPIIQDLANALDYAHSRGLVHRDVKPSNVLLQPITTHEMRKRAILTDFGIAKIRKGSVSATKTGVLMGTLDYIAPEQIRSSGEVDGRADTYSLGVLTYRMITGELPFTGDNPGAVMMAHLQTPPPDPRGHAPGLSDSAAEAILQALSKDPKKRQSTAGEFANALG